MKRKRKRTARRCSSDVQNCTVYSFQARSQKSEEAAQQQPVQEVQQQENDDDFGDFDDFASAPPVSEASNSGGF